MGLLFTRLRNVRLAAPAKEMAWVLGPKLRAWDLHRAWPSSRLVVLDTTGHGGPAMSAAMIEALNQTHRLR